jgi:hypothetical protein
MIVEIPQVASSDEMQEEVPIVPSNDRILHREWRDSLSSETEKMLEQRAMDPELQEQTELSPATKKMLEQRKMEQEVQERVQREETQETAQEEVQEAVEEQARDVEQAQQEIIQEDISMGTEEDMLKELDGDLTFVAEDNTHVGGNSLPPIATDSNDEEQQDMTGIQASAPAPSSPQAPIAPEAASSDFSTPSPFLRKHTNSSSSLGVSGLPSSPSPVVAVSPAVRHHSSLLPEARSPLPSSSPQYIIAKSPSPINLKKDSPILAPASSSAPEKPETSKRGPGRPRGKTPAKITKTPRRSPRTKKKTVVPETPGTGRSNRIQELYEKTKTPK